MFLVRGSPLGHVVQALEGGGNPEDTCAWMRKDGAGGTDGAHAHFPLSGGSGGAGTASNEWLLKTPHLTEQSKS